jgi:hypothetical protein
MKTMACAECGKPLRFREDASLASGDAHLEVVPCPYGAHAAGSIATAGFWESATMSPNEQAEWLASEKGGPAPP